MPSPFPGMNPYLEHPNLWPGLHHWLIIEIARLLSPQLRPKYRVAVEVRMYETSGGNSLFVGIPDVTIKRLSNVTDSTKTNVAVAEPITKPIKVTIPRPEIIKEGYLEVREVGTEDVVTTIEILSPTNKRRGKGRETYEEKRQDVLGSKTHLVEIDLLRTGEAMTFFDTDIESHYRILVCRGDRRPYADLYAFNLQEVIPAFPLPLRQEDTEPIIDLQKLLNEVYDISAYDLVIDYNLAPFPPLSEADAAWANEMLQDKGLRSTADSPEIPN
ncbi:DUF4058 family protein [Nostoc cycadae]|uniref:DUF4058 family protein n=1 Tax=Nostoc cycadae WK-1 TaxID=1861711 RepID=A0A2H6LNI5_9NOSO|nr:DUF4058 family protein [Nostoc cycadae]GBE94706.1 hypothetical protein NCWK1_4486 [Nostoc cycadae WK-1]